MFDFKFVYPEGGYVFYDDEIKRLIVEVENQGISEIEVTLSVSIEDYENSPCFEERAVCAVSSGTSVQTEFHPELNRLGYYKVTVIAECGETLLTKVTGLGVTTPHRRSGFPDSLFGVSANAWTPEQHTPMFARLGVSYLRNPGKTAAFENRDILKKHDMRSAVQIQGRHILTENRYAPDIWNAAYHYEKQMGDVVAITEHGNEHWDEHNLMLYAEWHKSSGLARLKANPTGWYTNSGEAGVDIHKLKIMHELGMLDYITCISVHAYTFPMAPEQTESYWSSQRLVELGEWMRKEGIRLPVACTEQGYPAMNGQTRCESYSPGDLVSLEGQVDYLVRSWLLYASLGVSKVIWYNGTFLDGFSFLEREGPAPWPAAMALAQLIRVIDHADYVGDYQADEGVYLKVFRSREDGGLLGAVWRPVYISRSCEKEKNFTPDGKHTEADGTAQEYFDYTLPFVKDDFYLKDIMGNPLESRGKTVVIGERPVYVYGFSEEILSRLTDMRAFDVAQVEEKPLPPEVLLGFGDANPVPRCDFVSSRFMPGESRQYKIRVHNFSDSLLQDTIVIEPDGRFTAGQTELPVTVPAKKTMEYSVSIRCGAAADSGVCKIHAGLRSGAAYPVYQIVGVGCPVRVSPLSRSLTPDTQLQLTVKNYSKSAVTYHVSVSHPGISFRYSRFALALEAGQSQSLPLYITDCEGILDPLLDVELEAEGAAAHYRVKIPLHYIEMSGEVNAEDLAAKQQMLLIDPQTIAVGDDNNGPSLFGKAEPAPMTAYARAETDGKDLYLYFNILDDTVVCVKNSRRNNIDSDGVWVRFYENPDDPKPYRHFCVMPADQTGNPAGCSVKEVSGGILFANPFTDYDFSKINVSSKIFKDRYEILIKVDLASVGGIRDGKICFDTRIVNMNHDDWSRLYDTGRITYTVI